MGSWRQGSIGVGCEGPQLEVQRKEGGARHSSRSTLVSGRGGWRTRGSRRGVHPGSGQWSSWQPQAEEESDLPGQVSPLPLTALLPGPSTRRRFLGARTARRSG